MASVFPMTTMIGGNMAFWDVTCRAYRSDADDAFYIPDNRGGYIEQRFHRQQHIHTERPEDPALGAAWPNHETNDIETWAKVDGECRWVITFDWAADQAEKAAAAEREKQAEARAKNLLLENLTDEQSRTYQELGYFDITGGTTGHCYRIKDYGPYQNVFKIDDHGNIEHGLCFYPAGNLQRGDVLLAQKTALELDEKATLATANVFERRRYSADDLNEFQRIHRDRYDNYLMRHAQARYRIDQEHQQRANATIGELAFGIDRSNEPYSDDTSGVLALCIAVATTMIVGFVFIVARG